MDNQTPGQHEVKKTSPPNPITPSDSIRDK
jgi:hypothetical protein